MRRTLVLILAVLGAIAFSFWLVDVIYQPYSDYSRTETLVSIPRGLKIYEIAQILESRGVVSSARIFSVYVRLRYPSASLKAGEYRFERPISLATAAAKLKRGDVYYHRITVPEGLTMEEIITLLERKGFGRQQHLFEAARDPKLLREVDSQASDLEGYLFPDTYFLTRNTPEKEIIRKMVDNFQKVWTPQRQQRAQTLGLTPREVVTLASLIEKETRVAGERTLVSAVFHNRLRKNMKLACDPTVIYAVTRLKPFDGVLHQRDLDLDSPYNTYLYPGLPPGPIANPGASSIDAALYPAHVEYLYFVSKNDGTHFFSSHYRDHSRAVRRYQH